MEKTYSQKVARVFEIVDYLLLIPSLIGMLSTILLLYWEISDLFSENGTKSGKGFLMPAVIWVMFLSGCWLLRGYFRHSRGRMSDGSVRVLWVGTIIYNSVFLVPTLIFLSTNIVSGNYLEHLTTEGLAALLPLVAIWASAVFFSATALRDNKISGQFR